MHFHIYLISLYLIHRNDTSKTQKKQNKIRKLLHAYQCYFKILYISLQNYYSFIVDDKKIQERITLQHKRD